MSFLDRVFAIALLSSVAAACGGSVDQVTPPEPDRSPARAISPTPGSPPATNESAPSTPDASPTPPLACESQPDPGAPRGTASCDVARTSLFVDVTGVTWDPPADAWKPGAKARVAIRYRNTSATRGIHYPGVLIHSSDPRIVTGTEAHGDGIVRPDFYMVPSCSDNDATHSFVVESAVPSGTRITLEIAPAVATGDDISSCGDTLRKSTFTVIAP